MLRYTIIALCISFPIISQAQSLKAYDLHKTLQAVAQKSNLDVPRKINDDLLDKGYTVENNTLINHIEVSPKQATQMKTYSKATYLQLGANVCRNQGFIKLLKQGAMLSYYFTEQGQDAPFTKKIFVASDCGF